MDIELIEIRDFLAAHHPFDALPGEALDRLPASLSVRYLRRGTAFPPPDADGPCLYVVRRGAVEVRNHRGELVDKLGEGSHYPAGCAGADPEEGNRGIAVEDTLLYLLPGERLDALRRDHPEFGRHFGSSRVERLKNAVDPLRLAPPGGVRLLTITAGGLLSRPPVFVTAASSIREAAQRMKESRVSSILVLEGERLAGLVTDRDMRSRCVAAGMDPARSVQEIMTTRVHTVASSAPGFDALMRMTQLNVHHLPVVDGERVVGVLSAMDLIRYESANSIYLVGDIHRAGSVEALAAVSRRLPELHVQLALAGASARNVGEAVSTVNDAITQRLLGLAQGELGPPPARFAWVSGGSHARREQTSHSDQDNALILADDAAAGDEPYFESLARFVNDGLDACGLAYCPGEVMARNPRWRQRRAQWRRDFDTWIREPEPKALMLCSVFFDLRLIHGDAALLESLQQENRAACRGNGIFLALLAANALKSRPPLGFFRNLVLIHGGEHDRTFDIKRRGIIPVVDLARVHALAEGVAALGTVERLREVAGSPALTTQGAQDLVDALDFISTLRVQHQARQIRAGGKADNFVAPEELSTLDRSHLKDAFAVTATMQDTLANRFPATGLS
jgi:CBS domain-containing protein